MDSRILFLFAVLLFLFPLASYCLFLGMLNSRSRPSLISGPWDFAGVLLATSGFLLGGGPAMLYLFYIGSRLSTAESPSGDDWFWWLALWLGYFAIVVGGAVFFLRRRRDVTVVYHVEPAVLDELLPRVLDQLQLSWTRVANRFFIGPLGRPKSDLDSATREAIQVGLNRGPAILEGSARSSAPAAAKPLPPELAGRRAGIELEPFASMCNVVLHWQADDSSVRRDVEAELDRLLRETPAPENQSASWFLTAATSLFGLLFLALLALIILRIRR